MKRSAPLRRHTALKRGAPLRPVGKKMNWRTRKEYIAFSQELRASVGRCQIGWDSVCTGQPDGIHHVIKRSAGGALFPSEAADKQGQVFMVACNPCNTAVEDHPKEARERGLSKPNPLRRESW